MAMDVILKHLCVLVWYNYYKSLKADTLQIFILFI